MCMVDLVMNYWSKGKQKLCLHILVDGLIIVQGTIRLASYLV